MTPFQMEIVTPDGLVFEGEATKLFCRTIDGDICILARHCNYLTALGMGEARVTLPDGTVKRSACIGGMLAVNDGHVRVVATTWEWAEDIDLARAKRSKQLAEEKLAQDKLDTRELELAKARMQRALVRTHVAGE